MNKIFIASFALLTTMTGTNVFAADHSLSLGYAQSKVENFKNMPGVNVQYRYEWDYPLSIIVSYTSLQNDQDVINNGWFGSSTDHVDAEYYSLMAGTAYRFNKNISIYALFGKSYSKMTRHYRKQFAGNTENINYSNSDNAFAYGAGVIINITQHVTMNVGYEGSQTKVEDQHRLINGLNIGVGYRF